MRKVQNFYQTFCRDEAAQGAVEYALIAGILSAISIVAWYYIASSSCSMVFYYIVHQLNSLF